HGEFGTVIVVVHEGMVLSPHPQSDDTDLQFPVRQLRVRHHSPLRSSAMVFRAVMASRVCMPPMRPSPLSVPLPPPNGRWISQYDELSLTLTMPVRIASATRIARPALRVQIELTRPNCGAVAHSRTSASSSNGTSGV